MLNYRCSIFALVIYHYHCHNELSLFLLAFSNNAADCCLSTSDSFVPRRIVDSYIIQNIDSGCPIPATVFITKKNRKLCSPPANDLRYPWVMKLVEYIDNRNDKSKERPGEYDQACRLITPGFSV
uniref:CC chemokine SCYA109 n=1 Tax=Ictalurus punctatus TaxID=7998 RepID=Q20IL1_ICTPU|nr:CC chemokine SCYA109 [Ictalurus punctatus]